MNIAATKPSILQGRVLEGSTHYFRVWGFSDFYGAAVFCAVRDDGRVSLNESVAYSLHEDNLLAAVALRAGLWVCGPGLCATPAISHDLISMVMARRCDQVRRVPGIGWYCRPSRRRSVLGLYGAEATSWCRDISGKRRATSVVWFVGEQGESRVKPAAWRVSLHCTVAERSLIQILRKRLTRSPAKVLGLTWRASFCRSSGGGDGG